MSAPGAYLPDPYPSGLPDPYPSGGLPAAPLGYLQGAPVSFIEAVKEAFRHGFVYRGRASRSAYWWFALFQVIVSAAANWSFAIPLIISAESNRGRGAGLTTAFIFLILWTFLVSICLSLVALSLTVRRLHDTSRSGWWIFIGIVPFAGPIVFLILTLLRGTPGPNRYQA